MTFYSNDRKQGAFTWLLAATGFFGFVLAPQAASSNDTVRVETQYDVRGQILRKSLPYFSGETVRWMEYQHDSMDRQILLTHPDGKTVATRYFPGDSFSAVEVTDENGNKRTTHFDAFGNEIYRDRFDAGTRMRTEYRYDALDRLTGITDPIGAGYSYFYDGHGNRIVAFDPGFACKEMVYDAANRLIEQRSVDGGLITYSYDELDRVVSKAVDKDALQFPSCSFNPPPTGNQSPIAVNDSFGPVDLGTSATLNVLANDSDPDGDALTVTRLNGTDVLPNGQVAVPGGTVTLNSNQTLAFQSDGTSLGSQSFDYSISDGASTVTATVTIDVQPQSTTPVAGNESVTVSPGGSIDIDVLANDSDPNGDNLTITQIHGVDMQPGWQTWVSDADGLVIYNQDNTLTYQPYVAATGTKTFTYTISDGTETAVGTITATIQTGNSAPVAANENVSVSAGGSIDIDVLANDSDPDGDPLTITQIHGVDMQPGWQTWVSDADGLVIYNQDNTLTYQPYVAATGTKTFTYTISDGTETAVGTITATIQTGDSAPVAANENVSVSAGGSIDIDVLANDSDPDGDPLTITQIHGVDMQPGWQTWVSDADGLVIYNQDNTLTYQPYVAATGTKTFNYTISDGGRTAVGTVTAVIGTAGTTPIAGDESISVAAGGSIVIDVLANDSDPNGDTLTITQIHGVNMQPGWQTWVGDADGLVIYNQNNTLTYQPYVAATGTKTFTYTISDGSETAVGTITAVITSGATN